MNLLFRGNTEAIKRPQNDAIDTIEARPFSSNRLYISLEFPASFGQHLCNPFSC